MITIPNAYIIKILLNKSNFAGFLGCWGRTINNNENYFVIPFII